MRYAKVGGMGTELRLTLPGPAGSADALRALAVLEQFLTLLGQAEETVVPQDARGKARTVWGFTSIGLGSLTATLAPNRPRAGMTTKTLADTAALAVDGLAAAEQQEGVPPHWDRTLALTGVDLAKLLGLLPSDALKVELLDDGEVLRAVTVTRRAEEHLRAGLTAPKRQSIGSAIGWLDSLGLHERPEAGLWLERGGQRVAVLFSAGQVETLREAWGRRVEVTGVITRDVDGRLLSIRMKSLEVLPDPGQSPALTELVGLDPNMTQGMDPGDYLGKIRGAS